MNVITRRAFGHSPNHTPGLLCNRNFIMAKQPEEWHYLNPEFDDTSSEEEEEDEIIWVSKSEIKRDAEALKKTGY